MAVRNSFEGAVVVSGSTEAEVDDVLILRASVYQNVNADFSSLVFQNWGAEDQVRVEVYSVANPGSAYVKTTHVSDLVIGGQWDDLVKGNRGDDRILGMDGNDKLRGESGADSLVGGAGRDKLWGGNGRDTLEGGTQNDRLVGGRGNDQLTGGSGADVFIFNDGDGRDTILDFGQGNDRLRLDEDIWGGGLEPEQLLDQYARVVNGNTLLEFDDQLIRLRGVTDPAALVDDISFF
nr:hypothetical protein [Leisingera sp. ANG59]